MIKQVQPDEKRIFCSAEGGPAPRGERQQIQPEVRKPAAPEVGPTGRGKPAKEQVQPEVRKPAAPEVGPTGRGKPAKNRFSLKRENPQRRSRPYRQRKTNKRTGSA